MSAPCLLPIRLENPQKGQLLCHSVCALRFAPRFATLQVRVPGRLAGSHTNNNSLTTRVPSVKLAAQSGGFLAAVHEKLPV
jgi:hypothetical protein